MYRNPNKNSDEEREVVVGGEAEEQRGTFEGVGEGEVSTPETMRTPRKRGFSITGISPEEATGRIHKQACMERASVQRFMRKEIMEAVTEMREYVRNDFNKANKENRIKYFEKRFAVIEEYTFMMDVEQRRAVEMAEKVGSIDRNMERLSKSEWSTDLKKEIESEVTRAVLIMSEQARQTMDEAVGRMTRKMEEVLMTAQHADEEREKSIKKAEAASKRTIESVVGLVGELEKRLGSVETFMEEVRHNMDRTFVEVQQVGRSMKDDLRGIAEIEKKTEVKVGQLTENLDVEKISMSVADARKVMGEVAEVIGSAARRVDRMEVDGEDEEGLTFAEVTRRRRRRPKGPTVVLEGPEGGAVTREQIVKCLDPKKGEVRIRGLRKSGKDYVVEVHAEEDIAKLRENVELGNIGIKVDGAAKLRWPRVYVHDVEKEIEREDLLEAIMKRNVALLGGLAEENVKQEFIPEFVRGRRDLPVRSWVVRVSPEMFKRLLRTERLYIGVRSCRVMEFNNVSRCYQCQGLGHVRKHCRDSMRCGYCAGPHDLMQCDKKDGPPNCINCQRYGLRDRSHMAAWRDCPAVRVHRIRTENITDYGS